MQFCTSVLQVLLQVLIYGLECGPPGIKQVSSRVEFLNSSLQFAICACTCENIYLLLFF